MKNKISKIISCLLAGFFINIAVYENAGAWTTQIIGTPEGHEILTKDGAYNAGSYYQSNEYLDTISSILSKENSFSKPEIIEAGWLKKWAKRVAAVATVAVVATALVAVVVVAAPVVASAAGVSVLAGGAIVSGGIVATVGVLSITGVLNKIAPYYGTYNEVTISLIAGSRYQDLREGQGYYDSEKASDQKFHFLRVNKDYYYSTAVMRDQIDNKDSKLPDGTRYGIKYNALIRPIIAAHRAENGQRRYYSIGCYDRVNVYPHHFAMGRVLHTVQDGYAHTIRDSKTWAIQDVMVYKPQWQPKEEDITGYYKGSIPIIKDPPEGMYYADAFEHESMLKTMFVPFDSHDRINNFNLGFFGLRGGLKDAAKQAQKETTALLKLWKNRNKSWAGKNENELIDAYFELTAANPNKPWGSIIDRICKHR